MSAIADDSRGGESHSPSLVVVCVSISSISRDVLHPCHSLSHELCKSQPPLFNLLHMGLSGYLEFIIIFPIGRHLPPVLRRPMGVSDITPLIRQFAVIRRMTRHPGFGVLIFSDKAVSCLGFFWESLVFFSQRRNQDESRISCRYVPLKSPNPGNDRPKTQVTLSTNWLIFIAAMFLANPRAGMVYRWDFPIGAVHT